MPPIENPILKTFAPKGLFLQYEVSATDAKKSFHGMYTVAEANGSLRVVLDAPSDSSFDALYDGSYWRVNQIGFGNQAIREYFDYASLKLPIYFPFQFRTGALYTSAKKLFKDPSVWKQHGIAQPNTSVAAFDAAGHLTFCPVEVAGNDRRRPDSMLVGVPWQPNAKYHFANYRSIDGIPIPGAIDVAQFQRHVDRDKSGRYKIVAGAAARSRLRLISAEAGPTRATHFVDVPFLNSGRPVDYEGKMGVLNNRVIDETKGPWQDQVKSMIAQRERFEAITGQRPPTKGVSYLPVAIVFGIGALLLILTAFFLRKSDPQDPR